MSEKPEIDYFFEFSSPYSYLAATQLDWVAEQTGAKINIKPMVLGAVFKEQGNAMPASVPAKGQYMFADLLRWAARYEVGFNWPPVFPVSSITAHRVFLVHSSFSMALWCAILKERCEAPPASRPICSNPSAQRR